MTTRIFRQSGYQALYFVNCGSTNRTLGCIFPTTQTATQLTLQDVFTNDDAAFFFVPEPVSSSAEKTFGQNLQRYLKSQSGVRFVWILDPSTLTTSSDAGPSWKLASFNPNRNTTAILNNTKFPFHNVSLWTTSNCSIATPVPTDTSLEIKQITSGSVYLASGNTQLKIISGSLTLPFCGSYAGTLQMRANFKSGSGTPDMAKLDMGIKMFYPTPSGVAAHREIDSEESGGQSATTASTPVSSLRYPLVDEQAARTQVLYPTLDPLHIMDPDRTFFSFADQRGSSPSANSFPTNMRTNLGKGLNLAPYGTGSKFSRYVFAQCPNSLPASSKSPLYLTPIGLYDLPNQPTPLGNYMCGLSGVEYIQLAPGTNTLELVQNQSAYAPTFDPTSENGGAQSDTRLTSDITTSWGYIRSTGTEETKLNYYAQPDKASLYDPSGDGSGTFDAATYPFLSFMPVIANKLPPSISGFNSKLLLPLPPYAGVTGTADELEVFEQFEVQIVSPERRARIYDIQNAQPLTKRVLPKPQAALTRVGTTPQGMLGTFSYPSTDPNDMATDVDLLLAVNEPDTGIAPVQFKGVPNPSDLWTALQTNQLFLVVSDPTAIDKYLTELTSTICIEDWLFKLDPSGWRSMTGQNPTMLIFKFIDKSLSDLAADLSAWALPNQFNDDNPQLASTQLQEYVAKTVKECEFSTSPSSTPCSAGNPCQNPDFQNIVCNVLLDENWNGILAINCPVPLDDLPAQLQGLAAGIDPAQFYGHHVGVNITPVNLAQNGSDQNGGRILGSLETKPSSIFGLIYYDDPAEIPIASGTYEFKVNTLQVLFENSKITSFASKIELQVNELFQEGSSIGDSDVANNIWFNGVYQNHNGEPSYTFRTTEKYIFTMDSQVLDTITLTQGQFVTEAADSDESTLSNFAFTGSINFKSLEGFDLFSFSDLDISNLIIEMLYTPNGDPERLFTFDASNLALDMAQSEARSKSLYQNFPLEMKSFVQADAGTTPVDLGFMSVTSPLQQGMPSYPWYGLEFTLGLGSLGGLAEQADFVATMIAAWNPTYDGSYSVFTGLKIPGFSGSKKELSLEGPLNLKIQNLQFYAGEIDCGDGNPVINYVLRLQSIKLSFFSVTMPPSGRTDFLLFGDPCSGKKSDMLGWYAVYDKGVEKKKNKVTSFGVHEVPPELVHDSLLLQEWRKD